MKDVILILDNSGSMKKNDPEFLTSRAVTEFIDQQDETTRIAIIIFDQNVSFTVPLTPMSAGSKGQVLKSLESIDYRGQFSDSPAAIERAIYELKDRGRKSAQKLIIFMTDGIVDTGNPKADMEDGIWLRESLAPDAADNDIRIFAIAFTEAADFHLIQSLAQKTDGEYFRVLKAEDLHKVFKKINATISLPAEEKVEAAEPDLSEPAPVVVEAPVQTVEGSNKEGKVSFVIITIIVVALLIAILAILVLVARRGRGPETGKTESQEYEVEAYLKDIHGYTGHSSYKLSNKPTMLGRVAGKDTEHLNYIVVPETTIGRRHALIEFKDFAYWLIEQGSINGTFVNDTLVTNEIRLKHGDRIRLHKYEFEFEMPEMDGAGMTVVSNTVVAGQVPVSSAEENVASKINYSFNLDELIEEIDSIGGDPEPTIIQEDNTSSDLNFDSEAETQLPDSDYIHRSGLYRTNSTQGPIEETLMPGDFEPSEEEATLRSEAPLDKISANKSINLDELEDNSDKKN